MLSEEITTGDINIPTKLYMKDDRLVDLEITSYHRERQFIIHYRSKDTIDIDNVAAIEIADSKIDIRR